MSTTKVKSLKEIKDNLERIPGKVTTFQHVDWSIDDLYDALIGLIKYLEQKEQEAQDADRAP